MAVRIRMKKMGASTAPIYRIVAIDARQPRDGRVIEELGTYDTDDEGHRRARHAGARTAQVLAVRRRQPSEHVAVFIKKYMAKWEQKEAEAAAAKTAPAPETAAPATT